MKNHLKGSLILEAAADLYFELLASSVSAHDITFIFPSRRASLFFRRSLEWRATDKPLFAPKTVTIDDFIGSLSPLGKADQLQLTFELYQSYQEIYLEQSESFDKFVSWGQLMLSDFDEIDRHLIDARNILTNTSDLNEMKQDISYLSDAQREAIISFWREFEHRPKTRTNDKDYNASANFLSFYHSLADIYSAFRKRLQDIGVGYDGLIYRTAAELESYDFDENARFVFVGLFALSPAEKRIMRRLNKNPDRCFFLWDYSGVPRGASGMDIENSIYKRIEANRDLLGGRRIGHDVEKRAKVSIIKCAGSIAQTKAIPIILASIDKEQDLPLDDIEKAIIPADESLLVPILSALPSDRPVNITMGYPLTATQVHTFFERWLYIVSHNQDNPNPAYRYSDVAALCSLGIVYDVAPILARLVDRIRGHRNYFITPKTLLSLLNEQRQKDSSLDEKATTLPELLFESIDYTQSQSSPGLALLDRIIAIINEINRLSQIDINKDGEEGCDQENQNEPNLSLEYLGRYKKMVERLRGIIIEANYSIEISTTAYLLESLVRIFSIPFDGEPLGGIQLMGMLETRVLNFQQAIILSASDGLLPKRKPISTLIPFSIRRGFGMPTNELEEQSIAYYFYRLANESEHLILLYSASGEGRGAAEESRYIHQMEYLYRYPIQRRTLDITTALPKRRTVCIKKTPEILEKLKAWLTTEPRTWQHGGGRQKALTASSIQTYVECPLRWYLHNIRELREPSEVSELIAANEFGDIFHETMQTIYQEPVSLKENVSSQSISSLITSDWFDVILPKGRLSGRIESTIEAVYRSYFDMSSDEAFDMQDEITILQIRQYVRNVLQYDRKYTPFRYLGSEVKLFGNIPISLNSEAWLELGVQGGTHVKLKGTIDRLDVVDNTIRVVDYKSGSIAGNKATLQAIELSYIFDYLDLTNGPYKEAMQIMLYAELVSQQKHDSTVDQRAIQPIIYGLKAMSKYKDNYIGNLTLKYQGEKESVDDYAPFRKEYLSMLQEKMNELFDPDQDFVQSRSETACLYCPFQTVCAISLPT